MIEIANIALPLDAGLTDPSGVPTPAAAAAVRDAAVRALRKADVPKADVRALDAVDVLKRSVDARKKSDVHFVATLGLSFCEGTDELRILEKLASAKFAAKTHVPYEPLAIPDLSGLAAADGARPVVVGSGPAGLFAALYLARAGLRPLVLERGGCVEERVAAIDAFDSGADLDCSTNIQFGEGGAGTFSDGKLTTNIKNPLTKHVLQWFVEAGAPAEICVLGKPHIGTDLLRNIIRTMRCRIEELGGEVRFHTQAVGFQMADGTVCGVEVTGTAAGRAAADSENTQVIPASCVILACGHSARDTFRTLYEAGAAMEQKPFSVGVRIEHDQRAVNEAQYGSAAGHPALGAADYKLAVHLPSGRSVYTFCMCPGGQVVCATSEPGGVVVNGMSCHARDGQNANSALLVGVDPADFGGEHPLAGCDLQKRIEHAAFDAARKAGGAPYQAPAQTVGDFLAETPAAGLVSTAGAAAAAYAPAVTPTYARGVVWCDLHDCLPGYVTDSLAEALPLLDRKLRGFADPGAVMTGVETRSSSPVRILRDESLQSPQLEGLYPCGEGAGYAGGIMSAAVDGLRVAMQVAQDLQAAQSA